MSLWHELADVAWKTPILYAMLLTLMRIGGKRQIGTFGPIDLAALIMMSEAALIAIADHKIPFAVGVLPLVLLGLLQWVSSYISLKSQGVRKLLEGAPTILVSHGEVNQSQMRKMRYNLSDLMAEMRKKNVETLADVEFAVLETSGQLSVFPRAGVRPLRPDDLQSLGVAGAKPGSALPAPDLPATVVFDGQVDEDALARAGRDRRWLDGELRRQGHGSVADVFLVTLDGKGDVTGLQPRRERTDRRDARPGGA